MIVDLLLNIHILLLIWLLNINFYVIFIVLLQYVTNSSKKRLLFLFFSV